MKVAVVYYSMSTNTSYVAEKLALELKADLISLEPEKQYPNKGFKKYFWGGKSALMGDEPTLKPYDFDSSKYDVVIFGTPVWASCYTPPLRTFIKKYGKELVDKKVGAYACYSGAGADKALEKLRKDLNLSSFVAQLTLIDPRDKPSDEKELEIKNFCKSISEL